MEQQEIDCGLGRVAELAAGDRLEEALAAADAVVAACPGDAEAHFARGKVLWRLGRRGEAMTAYETAVAADPSSGAATALSQAREVFAFFNPDLLNP